MPYPVDRFALACAVMAVTLQSAPVIAKTALRHVTTTEVTFKRARERRQVEIGDALRAAAMEEAGYYDPAMPAARMRIHIEKTGFKSAEKALIGSIPLVGMFAPENRNMIKGRVELVDAVNGKVIAKYKIECDDSTQMSFGDAALTYGKVGLSLLPFGEYISAAVEVAEGAANKREQTETFLTRGFIMLSYRKIYGNKLYQSFARQRKAAFEASRSQKKADTPALSVSTPAVPTEISKQ